ncbi:MAG: ribbon-helix-helix domain-containing protein [Phycisphaerae bacterium]
MAEPRRKEQVITLKVDSSLLAAMRGVANRSRFIRDAILAALENTCPLCMGSGILSPKQREHWDAFASSHRLRECPDCHEMHLTCGHEPEGA